MNEVDEEADGEDGQDDGEGHGEREDEDALAPAAHRAHDAKAVGEDAGVVGRHLPAVLPERQEEGRHVDRDADVGPVRLNVGPVEYGDLARAGAAAVSVTASAPVTFQSPAPFSTPEAASVGCRSGACGVGGAGVLPCNSTFRPPTAQPKVQTSSAKTATK